jgi:hypothetical protein
MEILWFIGFWNYNVFFAIDLSSLMIERKKFIGARHEKISIGFQTRETWLCFWFMVFLVDVLF